MEDEIYQQYFHVKENVDISDVASLNKWKAFCGDEGLLRAPVLVRLKKNKIENAVVDVFIEHLMNVDN
eukprot:9765186-Karenia_brevis.AAC.1